MAQDHAARDVGNIIAFEHVNIGVADQRLVDRNPMQNEDYVRDQDDFRGSY